MAKVKLLTAQQAKKAADKYLDDPKTIKKHLAEILYHVECKMEEGKYSCRHMVNTKYKKILDGVEAELVSLGYVARYELHDDNDFATLKISWGDPVETCK